MLRLLKTIFLCVLLLPVQALALSNQLKSHPSPYLALHGGDPVAWQPWDAKTIALARKHNKLLYVSIGYFSCHWCHVMQSESYRNPNIAKLLNQKFIPVKVDREINTALDAELQAFAEQTTGRAGWPLNVFITPDGYPLFATLYEPPDKFLQTVARVQERWAKESHQLRKLARAAAVERRADAVGEAKFAPAVGQRYRDQLVREALAQADMLRGGFGGVRRFPMAPQLAALLNIFQQKHQPQLAEFLQLTLDQMASQGLYDHVGGGFFRYTTDPDWRVPHFEKMLYDNAQLALLYLRAADIFGRPDYRSVALATLDFMRAEMWDSKQGAFLTSTSAVDAKNREGGVYLWTAEELRKVLLQEEYDLVAKLWGMNVPAEFDLGYLPLHRIKPGADEYAKLTRIYDKLKQIRARRLLPKDEKLLASLNGLALATLSEAARVDQRYAATALSVRNFLGRKVWQQNSLIKGMSKGQPLGTAELEDYAFVAHGALAYFRVSGEQKDLVFAAQVARQGWEKFHSASGWKQQDALLATRNIQALIPDSSLPSPSSTLIRDSWKMQNQALRKRALAALNTGYAELDREAFWFASQVGAMNDL
jgi:hypothetical protein